MSGTKWEYMTVNLTYCEGRECEVLNSYGANGWELVAVTSESEQYCSEAYLKRPLIEQPAPAQDTPPTDPDTIYARPESEGGAAQ